MPALGAKRILIYGVCGSGKTTLAKRLSESTGIPWHSVDDLTWLPGWTTVPDDDQREKIQEICANPEWILDTAYGKWIDVPLARVELVVGLDYGRWLSFWRLWIRCLHRAIDKAPICNGNVESWRLMFSRESILLWHLKSFAGKRRRISEWQGSSEGFTI